MVFRPTVFTANVGIREQDEVEKIISYLKNQGYTPIIRSVLSEGFRAAKLPEPTTKTLLRMPTSASYPRFARDDEDFLGEIFFIDMNIIILSPRNDNTKMVIMSSSDPLPLQQKFSKLVEDAIKTRFDGRRLRGMEFNWTITSQKSLNSDNPFLARSYATIQNPEMNFTTPKYDKSDLAAANLLSDVSIRGFLINLAKLKKMTSVEALRDYSDFDALINANLISKEFMVSCKNDKRTLCIIQSKESLGDPNTPALRCPYCNKCLSEEEITEVFTITNKGRELSEGSLWMSIWITELLEKAGVKSESIKWKIEANGDELDILVQDFGFRVFFELKDKEFGLGDAYNFSSRVSRYAGTHGFIMTTDKISPDTRKFLTEQVKQNALRFTLNISEGQWEIEHSIDRLVKDLSKAQIRQFVSPISERLGLNIWPIVDLWLNRASIKQPPVIETSIDSQNQL